MNAVDPILAAIADPQRRAMLARLAQGEATAGELQGLLGLSQPAVSHHVRVLEEAGLIERRRAGTSRPCRLAPRGLAPLGAWLDDLRVQMERSYQRLDDLLAEDPQEPPP